MNRSPLRAAAAVAAVLALAGPATATNYGRVTETNEVVTTTISPEGDADDFVFEAAPGYRLQAQVKAAKGVVIAPVLELVLPDGSVDAVGAVVKNAKTSSRLKATLAEGGRFALRVKASSGTGACTLKWKLTPAKVAAVKKLPMEGNTEQDFDVPARGGALLSWTLKWKGDGAAEVVRITDPAGIEVPFDPSDDAIFTRSLTSEKAKNLPIPADRPGGLFRLTVRNDLYPSTVDLSVKVAHPKLETLTVVLNPVEPSLTGISHQRSSCGVTVTLTGTDLDAAPKGVLFGARPATDVSVAQGAEGAPDTVSLRVPGGSGTVDVVFVASDGQVAVLPQAFTFNALPTILSFDPTVGPNVGRVQIVIYGTGFEVEGTDIYKVLIGDVECFNLQVTDSNTIIASIPANVSGPKSVLLRNRCGEEVAAPGQFTYSSLLSISVVIPSAVPTFGHVPVTVYGAGFSTTDEVYVDGALLPSTPVAYQGTVIGHHIDGADLPAHAPGKVDVKVRTTGGVESLRVGALAYFAFTDVTATAIPAASSIDDWGGVATAAVDGNLDGTVDSLVISHSTALSTVRPGTRVLRNNGSGVFTDATSTHMPAATTEEDFGANRILSLRMDSDTYPDLYLSRPGTGDEARRSDDEKFVDAWGRLLFSDDQGKYTNQVSGGPDSKFSIPGTLTYVRCYVYDFDFRSVAAAAGDLDGDLDQDIALVNDRSINWFLGVNCNYRWQTCAGGYYAACYNVQTYTVGSALRICTVGSTGSIFDRTKDLLGTPFSAGDDFRGAACAVADMDGDFLNDIVVTHDQALGATTAATRVFRQKSSGVQVTYTKMTGFLPNPSGAADDDWRGETVAVPDLNGDILRDIVVSVNGPMFNGRAFSTRILIQDPVTRKMEDRTDAILTGVLPAGDDGRAKYAFAQDFDKDGDADLFLCTPDTAGAGNRRTRLLLNIGKDPATGLPKLIDASSILPEAAADPGNAVSVLSADIDGDGDNDIILTDTRQTAGTPVKRTRVFRQDR